MAFSLYGMAVVVAPAIGPTLGGWITDNFNWHWIFFINLPVGLIFSLAISEGLSLTRTLVSDGDFHIETASTELQGIVSFAIRSLKMPLGPTLNAICPRFATARYNKPSEHNAQNAAPNTSITTRGEL